MPKSKDSIDKRLHQFSNQLKIGAPTGVAFKQPMAVGFKTKTLEHGLRPQDEADKTDFLFDPCKSVASVQSVFKKMIKNFQNFFLILMDQVNLP
ncbi:MAG: hypothetical protein ONB44_22380 [candidate division KSB1 bacterium]|nr:hypothetical protein [candidate division KSB1 bacterium]MDZ7304885.1 hypothetical protein [candidate division KSB1 bacterium]MDZ7314369.1 hypothetical protein [candidate division KSB1 bacterium]